jgi:hypothetical protein
MNVDGHETDWEELLRVPGLLRRSEIADVVEPGDYVHILEAGRHEDGTPLFAVFRRRDGGLGHREAPEAPVGPQGRGGAEGDAEGDGEASAAGAGS